MQILDHLERMFKEVIRPAYMGRLKGPDIHKIPARIKFKAMFTRMATMWEAERAQQKFDRHVHLKSKHVFFIYA